MQIADLLHKPNQPRIHLKPLDISVIEPYLEMLAEKDVARLTGSTATFTREQIEQWLLTRSTTPNRKDFGIFDQDRTFVGEVVLNEFNDEKNSMNIRIALRGKPWFNRGIGSQALALALEYAFDTLVVDKVTLDVLVETKSNQSLRKGWLQNRSPIHLEEPSLPAHVNYQVGFCVRARCAWNRTPPSEE